MAAGQCKPTTGEKKGKAGEKKRGTNKVKRREMRGIKVEGK